MVLLQEIKTKSRVTSGDIGELVEKIKVQRIGFAVIQSKRSSQSDKNGLFVETDTGVNKYFPLKGYFERPFRNPNKLGLVLLNYWLNDYGFYLAHAGGISIQKLKDPTEDNPTIGEFRITGDLYQETQSASQDLNQ